MEKLPRITIPTELSMTGWLGCGYEGNVYRHGEQTAIKIFNTYSLNDEKLKEKFKKIEVLGQLQNADACLPKEIAEYPDGTKAGYIMDLVNPHPQHANFTKLSELECLEEKISYIIQASDKIDTLHELKLFLGDISGENIMIDKNENVRFIDTDNWMYGGYDFNVESNLMRLLKKCYAKEFHVQDNDCFIFALLAMEVIQGKIMHNIQPNDTTFKNQIEKLGVSKNTQEGLRYIFSDAPRKTYIGEILRTLSSTEKRKLK